jgi:hypothetical protein
VPQRLSAPPLPSSARDGMTILVADINKEEAEKRP